MLKHVWLLLLRWWIQKVPDFSLFLPRSCSIRWRNCRNNRLLLISMTKTWRSLSISRTVNIILSDRKGILIRSKSRWMIMQLQSLWIHKCCWTASAARFSQLPTTNFVRWWTVSILISIQTIWRLSHQTDISWFVCVIFQWNHRKGLLSFCLKSQLTYWRTCWVRKQKWLISSLMITMLMWTVRTLKWFVVWSKVVIRIITALSHRKIRLRLLSTASLSWMHWNVYLFSLIRQAAWLNCSWRKVKWWFPHRISTSPLLLKKRLFASLTEQNWTSVSRQLTLLKY